LRSLPKLLECKHDGRQTKERFRDPRAAPRFIEQRLSAKRRDGCEL
jgi:hypothetical protein